MTEQSWLVEDLKPYPVARKALELSLSLPEENPLGPVRYRLLYWEKLLWLIRRAMAIKDPYLDELETFMGPRAVHWLPKRPSWEEVVDKTKAADEVNWQGPSVELGLYLQRRTSTRAG